MKKLLKTILALVFAACCFMFAAKCLKAGGFTGAIADFPTAIHRAVKGQMQTTTDYLTANRQSTMSQYLQGNITTTTRSCQMMTSLFTGRFMR